MRVSQHRRAAAIHTSRPRRLLVVLVAITGMAIVNVVAAASASAHGDDETTEGYVLVQQALGHLAHDTSMTGRDLAMEKIDDALNTTDQEGVDVAELQRAKAALAAGQVVQARTLLQDSITQALATLEPATGEETGTTVVLTPLPGGQGRTDVDWVLLGVSTMLLVVGVYLAWLFRPRDNVRALRRRLDPPAHLAAGTESDPSVGAGS